MIALRLPVAVLAFASALVVLAPAARADGSSGRDGHVRAELVSETKSVAAGGTVTLGLVLKSDTHWHVYWKNAGDAGTSPTIRWTLPAGATAGPILWPAPKRLVIAGSAVFVYEDEVLLPVEVKLPSALAGVTATFTADVEWLVCRDQECEPGIAKLTIEVPVAASARGGEIDRTQIERFAATRALLPVPLPATSVRATHETSSFVLRLSGPGPWTDATATLEFFPEADVVVNSATQRIARGDGQVALVLPEAKRLTAPPSNLKGTLVATVGGAKAVYDIDTPIGKPGGEAWLLASTPTDSSMSLLVALLLAFLGGIVLNLMPCVLPVLSLKVLGFVERAGDAPALVRRHGFVYGAGVIAAFGVLAGVLLALRAKGEGVGWGFQLQDPRFVGVLCLVMAGLGASMLGAIDFGASLTRLGGIGGSMSGYGASFLGGALATVVATPCTGPFMGPALGFALTLPAPQAVAILLTLGVGMALPYVLLAAFPRWLRWVPKPGAWMDTLKKAMAFPLFATAIWLAWVLGQQSGVDGMLVLLCASLVLCLGLWLLGHYGTAYRPAAVRWIAGRGVGLALATVAFFGALHAAKPPAVPLNWEPWSEERVAQAQAQGRPVLVDFTADWCLTCKVNEKSVLATDEVRTSVEKSGAVLLKADWTKKDARIAAGLARFGRASVPLYVVHGVVAGSEPVVLETNPFLTVDAVTTALDRASVPGSALRTPSASAPAVAK